MIQDRQNATTATEIHAVCVVQSMDPSKGGPPRAILSLANHLCRFGVDVDVLSADQRAPKFTRGFAADVGFEACGYVGPDFFRYSPKLKSLLSRLCQRHPENMVVYRRGLWMYPNCITGPVARRHRKPVLISPVGMLEPWAIQRSSWKKRLVSALFEGRNLATADCMHALRPGEAENFRKYGVTRPIAIVPNGVEVPSLDEIDSAETEALHETHRHLRGKRLVCHIGRVHPVKGLETATLAWKRVAAKHPDWHLVLAGPDERGHAQELQALIDQNSLTDRVSLIGPVFAEQKQALLKASEIFILASVMEAMSCGLLEAMAWRLPVVITRGCCLDEVEERQAGFVAEKEPAAFAEPLDALMSLSDTERAAYGDRGRLMVETKFDWTVVTQQMIDVFRWMLGQRGQPDFVWGRS